MRFDDLIQIVLSLNSASVLAVGTLVSFLVSLVSIFQASLLRDYRASLLFLAFATTCAGLAYTCFAHTSAFGVAEFYRLGNLFGTAAMGLVLASTAQLVGSSLHLRASLVFTAVALLIQGLMLEENGGRILNWGVQLVAATACTALIWRSSLPLNKSVRIVAVVFGVGFGASVAPVALKVTAFWLSHGLAGVPDLYPSYSDIQPERALVWSISPILFYLLISGIIFSLIARKLLAMLDTDALTGVSSRRALLEAGHRLILEPNKAVCALMIDIDHFKQINDNYGHAVGDEALRVCTRRIRDVVRDGDAIVGRLGGEEFCVLLAGVDKVNAMQVAERVREKINATPIQAGAISLHVSISVGVGQREKSHTLEDLLALADKFLYQAKSTGRNRVWGAETVLNPAQ
jgi:diguanylate cyclase (GGDEF)-like protein